MVFTRTTLRRSWICGVLFALSTFCIGASFWLSIAEKRNALPFIVCGFILALWAPVVTSRAGVSAKDVVAVLRCLRRGRRR
jgi:hypothetical protein